MDVLLMKTMMERGQRDLELRLRLAGYRIEGSPATAHPRWRRLVRRATGRRASPAHTFGRDATG